MFVKDKYHPAANSVTSTTVASKKNKKKTKKKMMTENVLFDEDSSNDDDEYTYNDDDDDTHYEQNNKKVVNSHSNQRYGAVACQIHARGVHTSLLMDVKQLSVTFTNAKPVLEIRCWGDSVTVPTLSRMSTENISIRIRIVNMGCHFGITTSSAVVVAMASARSRTMESTTSLVVIVVCEF